LFTLEIPSDWEAIIEQSMEDPPEGDETEDQRSARENRNALRELLEPQDDGWIRIRHYLPTQSFDLTLAIADVPLDAPPGEYLPLQVKAEIATEPRDEAPETIWESLITHAVTVTDQYLPGSLLNLYSSRVHEAAEIQGVPFDLTSLPTQAFGQYVAQTKIGTTPSGIIAAGRVNAVETNQWPFTDPTANIPINVVNILTDARFLDGVSIRWQADHWFAPLFREWSPVPSRETCYLRLRPTFATESVKLMVTAKKTKFRRDIEPLSFAQRNTARQFRRQRCQINEVCIDNGPSYSNPRWVIDNINTPYGPIPFPTPTARLIPPNPTFFYGVYAQSAGPISNLINASEQLASNDHEIRSATSTLANPIHSFGNKTSLSFDPTDRISQFQDAVRAVTTAYLQMRDPGDYAYSLIDQERFVVFCPPFGLNIPSLTWVGNPPQIPTAGGPTEFARWQLSRGPGDPSLATAIGTARAAGSATLNWQGGGTVVNTHPYHRVVTTISLETPPRKGVRLVKAILQFYYLRAPTDSLTEGLGDQGYARVERAATGETDYYAAASGSPTAFVSFRPPAADAVPGDVHAFDFINNGQQLFTQHRFEVAYAKEVPEWDGEPPVIEFNGDDIDYTWGFNNFTDATMLASVSSVITGQVAGPIHEETLSPDTGDLDDVTEYQLDRAYTNTGQRVTTFTHVPLDVANFSLRFQPAADAVGHPSQ
tara:strand:+ start:887 stop:3013 length:2127 start_codon:yes stop_codon:yes gene_type:complete